MASNRIVAVYSVEPGLDPTYLYIFEKKSLGYSWPHPSALPLTENMENSAKIISMIMGFFIGSFKMFIVHHI